MEITHGHKWKIIDLFVKFFKLDAEKQFRKLEQVMHMKPAPVHEISFDG